VAGWLAGGYSHGAKRPEVSGQLRRRTLTGGGGRRMALVSVLNLLLFNRFPSAFVFVFVFALVFVFVIAFVFVFSP
jgi:hypothetical protein